MEKQNNGKWKETMETENHGKRTENVVDVSGWAGNDDEFIGPGSPDIREQQAQKIPYESFESFTQKMDNMFEQFSKYSPLQNDVEPVQDTNPVKLYDRGFRLCLKKYLDFSINNNSFRNNPVEFIKDDIQILQNKILGYVSPGYKYDGSTIYPINVEVKEESIPPYMGGKKDALGIILQVARESFPEE